MKLTLQAVMFAIAACSFSSAASISVDGFVDVDFTTNPSDYAYALDSSWSVSVGYYDGTPLTIVNTYDDVNSVWTNVATVQFSTGIAAPYNGYFDIPLSVYNDSLGVSGLAVSIWVTNGCYGNLLLTSNVSVFASDGDSPDHVETEISSRQVYDWDLVLGSFYLGGANAGYGGSYVVNIPLDVEPCVPESSSVLLAMLASMMFIRRKRCSHLHLRRADPPP